MSDAVQKNPSVGKDSSSNPTGENQSVTQESAQSEQKKVSANADSKTNEKGDAEKNKREKKRQPKPRKEGEVETAENEIRVAAKGQIKNYLGYAFRILNKTDHKSLTIRATGNAIVKALILIELVKRRVGDLHQRNKIYSMEIESFEESKIEGMEKIATKRRVTAMDTELSKDILDENDPGYQKPEPKEEAPIIQNPPKSKDKKGGKSSKKHRERGPKLYNTPFNKDGDDKKDAQDGDKKKQRQDGDKDPKHRQENKKKKTEKREGGDKDQDPKKKKGKSRRENLRNLINDDEMPRGPRGMRGRGVRGGGPGGRGRGGMNMGPMMDREFGGPRFDPMYGQGYNVPRDDFHLRSQRGGGRGGRRGGPPDMYHPRNVGYNFGPQRGYDEHYDDPYYNNYSGGPMYPPRGRYNAPPFARDGMPPGGGPRGFGRPEFDGRQGQPQMGGRSQPMRGGRDDPDNRGPDHRGPDHRGPDHRGPDHRGPDHRGPDHRGPDHRGGRGGARGNRGRGGRDDGPPGDRPHGGPPNMRGGPRPFRGRGGQNDRDDTQPILHRRARGGGDNIRGGERGGHGGNRD